MMTLGETFFCSSMFQIFYHYPYGYLVGLTGLIVLLGCYWLHRRTRFLPTSALFLWDIPETSNKAGKRFLLRRLPLTAYLEIIVLLFLTLAVMSPFVIKEQNLPPLVIILDDSFSMQAGTPAVRQLAIKQLHEKLRGSSHRRIIVFLAGPTPMMISDSSSSSMDFLSQWTAVQRDADLPLALQHARDYCRQAEFLLITDHRPDIALPEDTSWLAFGSSSPNVAIVHAKRLQAKLLLEIANYSDVSQHATVAFQEAIAQEEWDLQPMERQKRIITIPEVLQNDAIHLTLTAQQDALPFDNTLTVVPEDTAPVTVFLHDSLPTDLHQLLNDTLACSDQFKLSSAQPELVITAQTEHHPPCHRLLWHSEPTEAFSLSTAPILPLQPSSLLQGLSFQGLLWSADTAHPMPGQPLLLQQDTTILSMLNRSEGHFDVFMNLLVSHGNVHRLPFWPSFFWNLAETVRHHRPGPSHYNWYKDEWISFQHLPIHLRELHIHPKTGGAVQTVAVRHQTAFLPPLSPGLYSVQTDDGSDWLLSVHPLSASESNLLQASSFRLQPSVPPHIFSSRFSSITWLAGALALVVLLIHQRLLTKRP